MDNKGFILQRHRTVCLCTSRCRHTIVAGCSTLLPAATTFQRRPSTSLTSACPTTGYSGGQRRWSGRRLFIRRQSVAHRLDADAFRAGLLSSALCRPDDWSELDDDGLTTPRSRRCWISLFRLGQSSAAGARQTHGLTVSAERRNA